VENFPDVIGARIEGTKLYHPGPSDHGAAIGSEIRSSVTEYPRFVKENSPDGEVWRRIDSAEELTKGETNGGNSNV